MAAAAVPTCDYALDELGSCWPPTAAGKTAQLPCPQIFGDIFLVDRTLCLLLAQPDVVARLATIVILIFVIASPIHEDDARWSNVGLRRRVVWRVKDVCVWRVKDVCKSVARSRCVDSQYFTIFELNLDC